MVSVGLFNYYYLYTEIICYVLKNLYYYNYFVMIQNDGNTSNGFLKIMLDRKAVKMK